MHAFVHEVWIMTAHGKFCPQWRPTLRGGILRECKGRRIRTCYQQSSGHAFPGATAQLDETSLSM